MLDEACAAAMVACFNTNPPQVRGRTVYVQFSNHRELKIDQSHSVIVSTNHFSTRYQFVGFFFFLLFWSHKQFHCTAQPFEWISHKHIHTHTNRPLAKQIQANTHTHKCIQSTKWTHNEQKLFPFETCPFFRCHYNSSWVFHFLLCVSLSLSFDFVYFFHPALFWCHQTRPLSSFVLCYP